MLVILVLVTSRYLEQKEEGVFFSRNHRAAIHWRPIICSLRILVDARALLNAPKNELCCFG